MPFPLLLFETSHVAHLLIIVFISIAGTHYIKIFKTSKTIYKPNLTLIHILILRNIFYGHHYYFIIIVSYTSNYLISWYYLFYKPFSEWLMQKYFCVKFSAFIKNGFGSGIRRFVRYSVAILKIIPFCLLIESLWKRNRTSNPILTYLSRGQLNIMEQTLITKCQVRTTS